MKVHKTHARLRQTVCKIKYDDVNNLFDFVFNHCAGHWRRVTCKNCIKNKDSYEKELKYE